MLKTRVRAHRGKNKILPGPFLLQSLHVIHKKPQREPCCSFFFFFPLVLCIWFSQDRVSLYSPGCPGTRSIDQAGLNFRNPPASASQSAGIRGVYHHCLAALLHLGRELKHELDHPPPPSRSQQDPAPSSQTKAPLGSHSPRVLA